MNPRGRECAGPYDSKASAVPVPRVGPKWSIKLLLISLLSLQAVSAVVAPYVKPLSVPAHRIWLSGAQATDSKAVDACRRRETGPTIHGTPIQQSPRSQCVSRTRRWRATTIRVCAATRRNLSTSSVVSVFTTDIGMKMNLRIGETARTPRNHFATNRVCK